MKLSTRQMMPYVIFFVMFCMALSNGLGAAAQASSDNPETAPKKAYLPVIYRPYTLPPFGAPQCVDCPRYFNYMSGSSLRLDSNDHPHIAYGSDHLYHAWNDGSAWHTEVVDSSNGVGAFAALALDSTGSPAISYYDDYNHALKVARWTGSAWVITTIDTANYAGAHSSITFDSAKHIHVAYVANFGGGYETHYALWNGSTWSKSLVLQGTDRYVSIAMDKADKPHISFTDDGGHLYYASLSGGAWTKQQVDTGYSSSTRISLAFDSTGKPHISWYDGFDALSLANWNGSSWASETASTGVDLEEYAPTTLVFDGSNNPVIGMAYYSNTIPHYRVGFIRKYNSAWKWGGGYGGKWASLAVDHGGKPHISYSTDRTLDYTLGQTEQLDYASLTAWGTASDTWTNVTVDQGDLVGPGAQLALDSFGRPSIAYYDISNNALRYASAPQGTWITQKVNPPSTDIIPAYGFAIAVDKSGKPHIAYSDYWITRTLYYASWTGSAWVQEPVGVDMGSSYDLVLERFISLALDASDNPRISFYDIHNNALEYFKKVGGVWQMETIDSSTSIYTGKYQSMALDTLGNPHISYQGGTSLGNLIYAHWTGSAWAKTTVDTATSTGLNSAITVDGLNHPHICYTDYNNEAIKYAHWTGSAWAIQTVTPNLTSADARWPRCSIQVGPAPNYTPYISYFDTVDRHLKLAHLVGSSWVIDTVDGNGDTGEFNAMVLFNSNLHFAYYHSGNKDLQYLVLHP